MRTNPVEHKFGKPRPYPVSFGIFKEMRKTNYGQWVKGQYKGYNTEVYTDKTDNAKLFYISDKCRKWLKSKPIYFENGIKKIIRSENG